MPKNHESTNLIYLRKIESLGYSPSDSAELRLRKKVLTISAFGFSFMAILWGLFYFAIDIEHAGYVPLCYSVVSWLSLINFVRNKNFEKFRFYQLFFILLLPFFLQWTLGGFANSSAVMIWALMAPLAAFFFGDIRYAFKWAIAYGVLTIITGLIDPIVVQYAPVISPTMSILFFTMNILLCSLWILFNLHYFKNQSEKSKQEAIDANNAKSDFIANMSHEMRTPLTAIIGFSRALLDSDQSAEAYRQTAKTIIRNGEHLLSIINDILDISKIEAGKVNVERINMSLFDVLREVEATFRPSFDNKKIQFSVNYAFPLPDVIVSDPLRIKQVLFNLCSNALKFTEQGNVVVTVSFDSRNNQLGFMIVDTGIGMSLEQTKKLFEKFTQADSSITRKYGGTGLGLAISRNFARLLGGDLTVSSAIGRGSRFIFEIDAGAHANEYLVSSVPSVESSNIRTDPINLRVKGDILVVDDVQDNRDLIKLLLRNTGAHFDTVDSGLSAIEILRHRTYDLVLMDMQMPIMDGVETIRVLRDSRYMHPIVILSANVIQNQTEIAEKFHCQGFLTKPIDVTALYSVVSRYLDDNANDSAEILDITNSNSANVKLFTNEKLSDSDHDDYMKIVNRFIDELDDSVERIVEKFEKNDIKPLLNLVHDMKGVSGSVGFPDLYQLSMELELAIKNNNMHEASKLLGEIVEMKNRIVQGRKATEKIQARGK